MKEEDKNVSQPRQTHRDMHIIERHFHSCYCIGYQAITVTGHANCNSARKPARMESLRFVKYCLRTREYDSLVSCVY